MLSYRIKGGTPLTGEIAPITNKNSILKLIPASLLTAEPVTIHNVPKTSDVRILLQIIRAIGGTVHYFNEGTSIKITNKNIQTPMIPSELSQRIRASLLFLGPLLARYGEAGIAETGGCKLGNRPIDTHFVNFKKMGAELNYFNGGYTLKQKQLQDTFIWQEEQSVTATENAILAAVLGKRTTVIYNAACEPHTQDLCHMLTSMGAVIEGIGSNQLTIQGVEALHGTEHTPIVEHLDVGTYIAAAAITNGEITIKNAIPEHMTQILTMYERVGVHVEIRDSDIFVPQGQTLEIQPDMRGNLQKIDAQPWPGFPVDLLPIAIVLATQAEGSMLLHNKLYESGLGFVDQLIKMKAQLMVADPHRVVTLGKSNLKGCRVQSPDIIQAGVALFLAALVADDTTTLTHADSITRRYPDIAESYRSLGANIEEV